MPTLDWLNRADAFTTAAKVPYRLLEPVSSHGDVANGQADNLLIQGDNLEALKALLPFYRGQVKCIFIDPPYNTKSAFEHYDDNLEHAQWLSMILPRLQLLRELLRDDGSIWVTIDDNEGHYLKVLMDEVFGRGNFVANVVWQKKSSPSNDARWISDNHDHILVFAKEKSNWRPIKLERTEAQNAIYKVSDAFDGLDASGKSYGRGPWFAGDMTVKTISENALYEIATPSGRKVTPADGRAWVYSRQKFDELCADNRITFGKDGNNKPCIKRFLVEVEDSKIVPKSVWLYEEVGENRNARQEIKKFNTVEPFSTPKPEMLLQRIIHIATNPGDLVLDSFLGSGTTAAVAHKMGRRWIGIEMGEHAATHCLPRLQKVIDGEQGGISKSVGWGENTLLKPWTGGGFRFLRLGSTVFDETGRINPQVRFATLAAFIWQQETGTSFNSASAQPATPYLGTYYKINSELLNSHINNTANFLKDSDAAPETAPKTPFLATSPMALFTDSNGAADVTDATDPTDETDAADSTSAPGAGLSAPSPQFALYLLFNGILGDKRPASGNVLTHAVLGALRHIHASTAAPQAPLRVYGEACRLGEARLKQANVTFRHIPYDVRAR